MKLWRNVLTHVGTREDARSALEASLRVAEAFGGRVTVFDAVAAAHESFPPRLPSARGVERGDCAVEARTRELRDVVADIGARVPLEVEVTRGALGGALLSCAERGDANLIVKAACAGEMRRMTHRGTGAVHVLREAAVPVWLCAPRERRSQRVVAAVNLSPSQPLRQKAAEFVLLGAARLALVENAELHVVCVVDGARDRLYHSILRAPQYRRYLAKDRHELRRSLAELMARIGPRSVPHLLEGDALEVVGKLALDLDADVVALGKGEADPGPGVRGTYFAERLFCRVERSLLLVGSESPRMSTRRSPRSAEGSRLGLRT